MSKDWLTQECVNLTCQCALWEQGSTSPLPLGLGLKRFLPSYEKATSTHYNDVQEKIHAEKCHYKCIMSYPSSWKSTLDVLLQNSFRV